MNFIEAITANKEHDVEFFDKNNATWKPYTEGYFDKWFGEQSNHDVISIYWKWIQPDAKWRLRNNHDEFVFHGRVFEFAPDGHGVTFYSKDPRPANFKRLHDKGANLRVTVRVIDEMP